MAKKIKDFEEELDELFSKKKYKTFTIKDTIREIANETIVLRASLDPTRKKLENFSEFIRNLIVEENERQKKKLQSE